MFSVLFDCLSVCLSVSSWLAKEDNLIYKTYYTGQHEMTSYFTSSVGIFMSRR